MRRPPLQSSQPRHFPNHSLPTHACHVHGATPPQSPATYIAARPPRRPPAPQPRWRRSSRPRGDGRRSSASCSPRPRRRQSTRVRASTLAAMCSSRSTCCTAPRPPSARLPPHNHLLHCTASARTVSLPQPLSPPLRSQPLLPAQMTRSRSTRRSSSRRRRSRTA